MKCQYQILAFAIFAAVHPIFALASTPTIFQETSSSSTPLSQLASPTSSQSGGLAATKGSSCIRGFARTPILQISTFIWTVHIPGQMMPSTQGSGEWGGGFLDQLRIRCGIITMWFAQLDAARPPNTGVEAMFYSQTCTLQNVQDAAFAASNPEKRVVLHCVFPHGGGGVIPIDGESNLTGSEIDS